MTTSRPRRPRRRVFVTAGIAVFTVSVLALVAGTALGLSRASALWHEVTEAGMPGYLTLRADPAAPDWHDLAPGDTLRWLIEASLADAQSSTLDLELRSEGSLVHTGQIHVAVTACTEPSSGPTIDVALVDLVCAGDTSVVLAPTPLAAIAEPDRGEIYPLARLYAGLPRYLLVTLTVPATADVHAMAGTAMRVGVGLHASGDAEVSPVPPPPTLVVTGADLSALSLLGIGLLGAATGAALLRSARRRS